jgi:hypothetical protein
MILFQNRVITQADFEDSQFNQQTFNYLLDQGNKFCRQYQPIGQLEKYCPNGLYGQDGLPYEKITKSTVWLFSDVSSFEDSKVNQRIEPCSIYYCGEGCLAYVLLSEDTETLKSLLQ